MIERGLNDPRADHESLRALTREHTLDDPPAEPARSSEPAPPEQVAPPVPAAVEPARWIPPHDEIAIGDVALPDGMIWIGPSSRRSPDEEPSLVAPDLAARAPRSERAGRTDTERPSYRELSAEGRGAYLLWLADGRLDADAPKAFPTLFVYGLERRLVVDADGGRVARSEIGVLVRELLALAERSVAVAGSRARSARWRTGPRCASASSSTPAPSRG